MDAESVDKEPFLPVEPLRDSRTVSGIAPNLLSARDSLFFSDAYP